MITTNPKAGEKVRELILGDPGTIGLREYVKGKGSHGHQYDMSLESKMEDEDMGIEMRGVKVIMDSQRAPLCLGSEVDQTDGM